VDGGNLYITHLAERDIRKTVIATSSTSTLLARHELVAPWHITSANGTLYVAENYGITQVTTPGGVKSVFVGGTQGYLDNPPQFYNPASAAVDGGFLYVADQGAGTIKRVNMSTQQTVTLAGFAGDNRTLDGTGSSARFNQPFSLEPDGAGNLYVGEASGTSIRKVNIATGKVTTLSLTGVAITLPVYGLCIFGDDLYVSPYSHSSQIIKLTRNY
jgi:hypothetical protein